MWWYDGLRERGDDDPEDTEVEWLVHRRPRTRKARAALLVEDCEAFYSGRLAERYEQRVLHVPAWSWMNLLAHGTEADLARAQRTVPDRYDAHGEWHEARSFLAGEILGLAGHCGSLDELQRAVLIPLELDLAERAEEDGEPRAWVTSVQDALARHRRAWRRCEVEQSRAAS